MLNELKRNFFCLAEMFKQLLSINDSNILVSFLRTSISYFLAGISVPFMLIMSFISAIQNIYFSKVKYSEYIGTEECDVCSSNKFDIGSTFITCKECGELH